MDQRQREVEEAFVRLGLASEEDRARFLSWSQTDADDDVRSGTPAYVLRLSGSAQADES